MKMSYFQLNSAPDRRSTFTRSHVSLDLFHRFVICGFHENVLTSFLSVLISVRQACDVRARHRFNPGHDKATQKLRSRSALSAPLRHSILVLRLMNDKDQMTQ